MFQTLDISLTAKSFDTMKHNLKGIEKVIAIRRQSENKARKPATPRFLSKGDFHTVS